ncbi:twin-arginine translocase subunit TatC [Streptacidiphilus carbonis]|uniref:twin-arginine translocase subunit TatC n=1 Tax=Streptacidiphilus carbonis TaxID=105422 RepID=UPI0006950D37|nr:twin-arginine translocase subunit TatC [Streptacidiphilus carbonis]
MSDTQGSRRPTVGRQKQPKDNEGRMPLSDHLRELRNRLLICLAALLVTTVLGWMLHNWLIDQLTGPACAIKGVQGYGQHTASCPNGLLVNNGVLAPLSFTFKISMMAGLILASPVWTYQLWAFVAPGLYKKEKKYGLSFTAAAVPLFLIGAYLAYWIFPKALGILVSFNPSGFSLAFSGAEFLDFFIRMVVVFGLSFELPLLLVALNFLGILSAAKLRSWWRGIIFIIFVFSAVATPTGDPLTMSVLAVPICVLFIMALGVCTLHDRSVARRKAVEDPDSLLDPDIASSPDLTPSDVRAETVSAEEFAHAEPMVYHPDEEEASVPAARGERGERMDDIT